MKSAILEEENEFYNTQPGFITVKIRLQSEIFTNMTEVKVDPRIPFDIFSQQVKGILFAQISEVQFLDKLQFISKNQVISVEEKRTLEQLGFQNYDILDVKLKLKGGSTF